MSEINELKKQIDSNTEIIRASHFQTKGRLSKLEKRIAELEGGQFNIEELKKEIKNLKRKLKNLWGNFKLTLNNSLLLQRLKYLNKDQLQAVRILDGPLLISAGPGSGKTKTLTYRIAYLIDQEKATPLEILAVTFTKKAAKEIQDRVQKLTQNLNISVNNSMWISTFHSICFRILKEYKELTNNLVVYTSKEKGYLIKTIFQNCYKKNIYSQCELLSDRKLFSNLITLFKILAKGPEDLDMQLVETCIKERIKNGTEQNMCSLFHKNCVNMCTENKDDSLCKDCVNFFIEKYYEYEKKLKENGAVDFEGLLLETYKLFLNDPKCLEQYRNRFKYIFVDEYQDTNHIQYLIIKLLAEKHRNICVVGDEDQSIYSWRGADISNIHNFDRDFPEGNKVMLAQNYRSTKNIILSASAMIKNNICRQNKELFTQNPWGTHIKICKCENEYEEADYIAYTISNKNRKDSVAYKNIACLYRMNTQSKMLQFALRRYKVPYKIIDKDNVDIYNHKEIQDIIAYLKFISNSEDEKSLEKILKISKRGISNNMIKKIKNVGISQEKSLYSILKQLSEFKIDYITEPVSLFICELTNTIESLKSIKDTLPLFDFYEAVLEKTGYAKRLEEENSVTSLKQLDHLKVFGDYIKNFEILHGKMSLESFLQEIDTPQLSRGSSVSCSDSENRITLMTLHQAKGLEFDTVFIVGMEQEIIPHSKSMSSMLLIEEERRLAYVGMTRAKKDLFLSYKKNNKFSKKVKESQFLKEIPYKYTTYENYCFNKIAS